MNEINAVKQAAPAAPLRLGSPSLVDGVFGATGTVTITREHALSVLREVNGQISWLALNKLGRLFASPIAYLSDEERGRWLERKALELEHDPFDGIRGYQLAALLPQDIYATDLLAHGPVRQEQARST